MNNIPIDRSRRSARSLRRVGPRRGFIERMGELLEQVDETSNAERIQRMREAAFADVDALQKSGRIKLPE